ncbi:unnamed protein product [Schistosoma rodhaini]|uniref:Uncharacterized protein n=1 Tax=Schistosoma rodhaini TaxID=6188 RepID=A0AA85FBC2_9TREM|nr:unnamed protein product [Schistosoma rodhaini]
MTQHWNGLRLISSDCRKSTRIQYVRVSSYLKLVRWKCLYLRVDIQLLQYEGAQYERRVYSYIHIYRSDM